MWRRMREDGSRGQGRLGGRLCVLPAMIKMYHGGPTHHTEHQPGVILLMGMTQKRWPGVFGLTKEVLIRNSKSQADLVSTINSWNPS